VYELKLEAVGMNSNAESRWQLAAPVDVDTDEKLAWFMMFVANEKSIIIRGPNASEFLLSGF
jgi:hypothetical protein